MSDDPDEQYRKCADALAAGMDLVIEDWVIRIVMAHIPPEWDEGRRERLRADAAKVAGQIRTTVAGRLAELFALDVEHQRFSPIGVLRGSVGPVNALLEQAHFPPPQRDSFDVEMFPDDHYELSPANFDEVDPSLHDLGLEWGAAKAHVVLSRHKDG